MCLIGERELRPAQTALDSTPPERSLSSMDATAIRRAYESSAGPAKVTGGGMPPPPTPPKTRPTSSSASSAGSVRSQANEARRHAGGRTSGNGPDTTERAPLDARGWVPSVFRARPANRNVSIGMSPVRGCPSLLYMFFAVPSPRGKGAKGKSRGEGRPAARRGSWGSPQGEGRAQRVPGYFSRGQLSFPGQQGRRCTLRAARGARGG